MANSRCKLFLVEKHGWAWGLEGWRVVAKESRLGRSEEVFRGTEAEARIIAEAFVKIGYTDCSHFRCTGCNNLLGWERGPICSNCECDRENEAAADTSLTTTRTGERP